MPAIGDTLVGRYRIDGLLGSGGMATVYRGRDLRLERDVAIKVLLAAQARDPTVAERFDREARAMAAVRHPAIVAIYDVEPADPPDRPEPFFVMELCEGGSLADMISGAGTVPPDHLIPIVVAVGGGLGELHGRGVVHRDVKPHNILLAGDGARLGDLGVAHTGGVERPRQARRGPGPQAGGLGPGGGPPARGRPRPPGRRFDQLTGAPGGP